MGPVLEFGDRFIRHIYVLTICLTVVVAAVLLGFKPSVLPSFLIGSAIGLSLFWSIEFMVRRLIRPGKTQKTKYLWATSKLTGGRRHPLRIRRKYEIDRYPNEARTGAQETITRKVRGRGSKTALKTVDFVNLAVPGEKVRKTKILKVLDNPTNNDYKRRGIITKGAILETQEGRCRIVSRPGQNGSVAAVLIE